MEQYPNYSQPPQQQQYSGGNFASPVMTVGSWIVTMLIMCIPIVNLVMLIVWASSSTENPNRKNWAVAQLIFMAIGVVLWIVAWGAIMGMLASIGAGMN